MYDYTDKAIKYLDRRYIRMFGKVRALASFDEVHVMSSVKSLYGELERLTREIFLRIARRVCTRHARLAHDAARSQSNLAVRPEASWRRKRSS